MALAQAEIAEISDSMSLSEDSSDFSWVSQIIFPGPETLIPQKPKKTSIFPEGHPRGHVILGRALARLPSTAVYLGTT